MCGAGQGQPAQMPAPTSLGLGVPEHRRPGFGAPGRKVWSGRALHRQEVESSHHSSLLLVPWQAQLCQDINHVITARTPARKGPSLHQHIPEKTCRSEASAVPTPLCRQRGCRGREPGQAVPLPESQGRSGLSAPGGRGADLREPWAADEAVSHCSASARTNIRDRKRMGSWPALGAACW